MKRNAVISPCGAYRYSLSRAWSEEHSGAVLWIMLNPSTADGEHDDATVRRCISFSREWGYGGMEVVNLFAYRSTDPSAIPEFYPHAVGPENDAAIASAVGRASIVIAAWGAHPFANLRSRVVTDMVTASRPVHCIGQTKDGRPRHPLYVRSSRRPEVYASVRTTSAGGGA